MNELIAHWQNGASSISLIERIGEFSQSSVPAIKDFGYSHAWRADHFDDLVDSRWKIVFDELCTEFQTISYEIMKRKLERGYESGRMSIYDVYREIRRNGGMREVKDRLYDLMDLWQTIEDDKQLAKEKTGLAYFVSDKQNVHTTVVTQQTNTMMDELAKQAVKKKQQTLDEILTCWQISYTWAEIEPVYNDMKYWGKMSEVIVPDDYAYRVALRALWAKIKTYEGERRTELEKRLFEECLDSVGVCAHGHMTRLANVLVGFDATIVVIKSESLQDRMATISLLDLDTELKIAQATKVMDEMNISIQERAAWLEAF